MKDESPCKRKRRRIDDEFFACGDRIAHQDSGTIFYMEEHPIFTKHEDPMDITDEQKNNAAKEKEQFVGYPCCVPGCMRTFATMLESHEHFEEQHVFQCGECHDVFSCNHLLELHLQEVHDSYFEASVERNQATFKCLVESCSESFSSPHERLEHLQSHHHYPRWFRFPTSKGDSTILKKKEKWVKNHNRHSLPPTVSARMQRVRDDDTKKKKRREQQREKRATIPCRYFATPEGCWRGDSCAFLHEKQDVDMTDLVQDMERKAQVSVPDNISFGRRRRGPY